MADAKQYIQKLKSFSKSKIGSYLKIVFSLLILAIFFYTIDTDKLLETWNRLEYKYIAFLIFLIILRNFVGALRFERLIRVIKRVSVWLFLKHYFVSSLFNNFLPTSIGGDGVRVLLLDECNISKLKGGMYILLERIIGLFALIFIAFVSSFVVELALEIRLFIYAITLGAVLGLFVLVKIMQARPVFMTRQKFLAKILELYESIKVDVKTLSVAFLYSIVFQIITIYTSYIVAVAFQIEVSFGYFLAFVPLIWLFTMLPVSFGGVGLRELSFVYLFAQIGMTKEDSLVISLGTYFSLVASGVIGAILMLYDRLFGTGQKEDADYMSREPEAVVLNED